MDDFGRKTTFEIPAAKIEADGAGISLGDFVIEAIDIDYRPKLQEFDAIHLCWGAAEIFRTHRKLIGYTGFRECSGVEVEILADRPLA